MKHHILIAIDLAKKVFQVAIRNRQGKIISNKKMNAQRLRTFLSEHTAATVAMESGRGSGYWGRFAQNAGHEVLMIPPKHVKPYRTGQKTDANDALAIIQAAQAGNLKLSRLLSEDDQALQCLDGARQMLSKQQIQLSNEMRGFLCEYGIVFAEGKAAFCTAMMDILHKDDGSLPPVLRQTLEELWQQYLEATERFKKLDRQIDQAAKADPLCREFMACEGVGPVGAIQLKLSIDTEQYASGRCAAVCLGATPKQESSGDKVRIGHVPKHGSDMRARSVLFVGALSVVWRVMKREPRTHKEAWLKQLAARRGARCAAMALVAKTIRTAYAMAKNGEAYRVEPLVA